MPASSAGCRCRWPASAAGPGSVLRARRRGRERRLQLAPVPGEARSAGGVARGEAEAAGIGHRDAVGLEGALQVVEGRTRECRVVARGAPTGSPACDRRAAPLRRRPRRVPRCRRPCDRPAPGSAGRRCPRAKPARSRRAMSIARRVDDQPLLPGRVGNGPGSREADSRDQPAPVIGEQQHRVLARVGDRDIAARGGHRHGAAQDTDTAPGSASVKHGEHTSLRSRRDSGGHGVTRNHSQGAQPRASAAGASHPLTSSAAHDAAGCRRRRRAAGRSRGRAR